MLRPVLGITAGDPAGIGAEVVCKALNNKEIYDHCIPVVIGDNAVLEDSLAITGLSHSLRSIGKPEEALGLYGTIDILDMQLLGKRNIGIKAGLQKTEQGWNYGIISKTAGEAAFRYIEKGISLAMEKSLDALVTAPINKEALNLAGHCYAGHTEILSELTGCKDYAMLLLCGKLRVVHVTTHVSLKTAADLITMHRVLNTIRLAHKGLMLLGCFSFNSGQMGSLHPEQHRKPRIAVAGFNPHASEGGLFGDEENRAIIPAVQAAQTEGIDVSGPLPPDTVFVKALSGQYDAVIAMYHDQGHIPLKLLSFKLNSGEQSSVSGINCTLGLPIIRTSVDHGTAFDIAGKNCSSEQSMTEAIEAAYTMARQQFLPNGN